MRTSLKLACLAGTALACSAANAQYVMSNSVAGSFVPGVDVAAKRVRVHDRFVTRGQPSTRRRQRAERGDTVHGSASRSCGSEWRHAFHLNRASFRTQVVDSAVTGRGYS